MKIAPEGVPFVAGGVVVLAAAAGTATLLGGRWWFLPVALMPVVLWVPWFFRDPVRRPPLGEHLVVAPADGRIVSIKDVENPEFLDAPATRVSIFMNIFNVHVNRIPTSGTVAMRAYRPGRFVNATLDKASDENEQMSLGIRAQQGRVLIRQIAGLVARRIVCDYDEGAAVTRGDRLGLIRFGSRVDTFLPKTAVVQVTVGDRTVAGETVLAEWPAGGES